jgi:hypothetical protein
MREVPASEIEIGDLITSDSAFGESITGLVFDIKPWMMQNFYPASGARFYIFCLPDMVKHNEGFYYFSTVTILAKGSEEP